MLARQTTLPIWPEAEVLRVLRGHAWRTGQLADLFARQAVRAAAGGGFEVAHAALDELLVRFDRSTRDRAELGGRRRGWYVVGPHEVWIASTSPLAASCGCDDFLRSSLGACVHVMTVLRYGGAPAQRIGAPTLTWDPIRPLDGAASWMARLRGDGDREDPAVTALRARDERLRIPRFTTAAIDAVLGTLHLGLYPYQRAGVQAFFGSGRLVLADDMGLGKTAQAIAIAHALFGLRAITRALVVVPAPLKWQWQQEWSRFSGLCPRLFDPAHREGIQIVSYEQARRDVEALQRLDPELVILDEAQRIKNARTLTARELKRLAPRWRVALTGTPLENRLEELASIASWVDDHVLEPVWRLRAWHAVHVACASAGDNEEPRAASAKARIVGVRGLDTLRARLAPHFLRRVRSEVLAQLPARTDTEVPLLLDRDQRAEHEALTIAIARVLAADPFTALHERQLMRLLVEQRLVCNGLALARCAKVWPELEHSTEPIDRVLPSLHSPKLAALRELFASIVIEQRRKVVVFSQWRRMLQLAEHATRDILAAPLASAFFTGAETSTRRIDSLRRFHDDDSVRVLWSTDAGALGLNLQAAASCCINLDLPWNPAVLEQRVARLHRLGQRDVVDVYNLVTIDGIEGRIAQLLATKRSIASGLLDSDAHEIELAPTAAGVPPSLLRLALAEASSARPMASTPPIASERVP